MAILSSNETLEARAASGSYRQPNRYTRSFLVQTDNTAESLLDIALSCGIVYGDAHPDDASAYCIGFNVRPVSGDMCLLYNCEFEYGLPPSDQINTSNSAASMPAGQTPAAGPSATFDPLTVPVDSWTGSSVLASRSVMYAPTVQGTYDSPAPLADLTNTAGTFFPGVEIEEVEQRFTLTRCYRNQDFLLEINKYAGSINNDDFLYQYPYHVRCDGASYSKVVESNGSGQTLTYWRVDWTFTAKQRPWKKELASIGYTQIENGEKVPCLDGNGEPVTEPANLLRDGSQAPPGTMPATVEFFPYKAVNMAPHFGEIS